MGLIDADVLKKELWKERASLQMMDDSQTADKIMCGIYRAERCVSKMPTVDAEPVKHGQWIMKPNGYGTCSNCKVCSLDILGGVHSNYCPNCGAKMTLD